MYKNNILTLENHRRAVKMLWNISASMQMLGGEKTNITNFKQILSFFNCKQLLSFLQRNLSLERARNVISK